MTAFCWLPADLSPQDSILLSDVVEVGLLPSFPRGDQEILHGFFILTSRGSRSECASLSKVQVSSYSHHPIR